MIDKLDDFLTEKAINRLIYELTAAYSSEAARISINDLYKNFKERYKIVIDESVFKEEVRDFILSNLIPSKIHSIYVDRGKSRPVSELLYEAIATDEPYQAKINYDNYDSIRLYSFYDNRSKEWRTDWIQSKCSSNKWYDVYYRYHGIISTGLDPEPNRNIGVYNWQIIHEHYLASSSVEAISLFIINLFGDHSLANGIKAYEEIIKAHACEINWDELSVSEDTDYHGETDRELWCRLHLGYFSPDSGMIDPHSIWCQRASNDSLSVMEAYDWYKMIFLDQDTPDEFKEYYEISENDLRKAGLISFEEATKGSHYTFWDFENQMLLFLDTRENLFNRGIMKAYRSGDYWLHGLSGDDARNRFYAFHLGMVYARSNNSGMTLENKAEAFIFLTSQEVEPYSDSNPNRLKCIDIPEDFIKTNMFRMGTRKHRASSFIDGYLIICKHIFSTMSDERIFIMEPPFDFFKSHDGDKTMTYDGYNEYDAQGQNIPDENERSGVPYTVSPYSSRVNTGFNIPFDSMFYYTVYYYERDRR